MSNQAAELLIYIAISDYMQITHPLGKLISKKVTYTIEQSSRSEELYPSSDHIITTETQTEEHQLSQPQKTEASHSEGEIQQASCSTSQFEFTFDDLADFDLKDVQIQELEDKEIDQRRQYRDLPQDLQKTKKKERKNNRKVRTTITKQKLAEMNGIFAEYTRNKEEGKAPKLNLKEIGNKLALGYSTILHKYRQYRSNKTVKGGALIASLQKKRKYKKSKQIEAIIERALCSAPFYTAVQLSDYIFKIEGKRYSRSIISRHLGEMGYSYKNLKHAPIEKNKPGFKKNRLTYCLIIAKVLYDPNIVLMYLDELAISAVICRRKVNMSPKDIFNDNPLDYVSIFLAATSQGVVGCSIKRGFYTKQDFLEELQECLKTLTQKLQQENQSKKILVLTDLNKIHMDPFGPEHKAVKSLVQRYNATRYYLPPASPHLNPIESMFAYLKGKLSKKEILGTHQLQNQVRRYAQDMRKDSVDVYFQDVEKSVKEVLREENREELWQVSSTEPSCSAEQRR